MHLPRWSRRTLLHYFYMRIMNPGGLYSTKQAEQAMAYGVRFEGCMMSSQASVLPRVGPRAERHSQELMYIAKQVGLGLWASSGLYHCGVIAMWQASMLAAWSLALTEDVRGHCQMHTHMHML